MTGVELGNPKHLGRSGAHCVKTTLRNLFAIQRETVLRENPIPTSGNVPRSSVYRSLGIVFCFLLGMGMIINNQFSGEATWFWYTVYFHQGAKLYSQLHLVVQPLFILEMDAWTRLFGTRALVVQIPSVIHLALLCSGLALLMRESDWPDWQQGIAVASAFVLWMAGGSYRFDDYHVTTEIFALYSLILLLKLAKAQRVERYLQTSTALGLLCGLTVTTRINDGAALWLAIVLSLLVLVRKRKLAAILLFMSVMVPTILVVVRLTGDSFHSYIFSTLIRAAGSKGGSGSIFAAPILLLRNCFRIQLERKWILPWLVVLLACGVLVRRYWKDSLAAVVGVQLALAAVAFAITSRVREGQLLTGTLVQFLVILLTISSYLLAAFLIVRFAMSRFASGRVEWDRREVVALVPLGLLASIATSSAGGPLSAYYSPLSMLMLLITILQPRRKQMSWANGSWMTMCVLLLIAGTTAKVYMPYFWNNEKGPPMFTNRQWYEHPIYGPMYIEKDKLQFMTAICSYMGPIGSQQQLLSLPFSYPNYFCAVPPWHGYVQTFFDISTRSTIDGLIEQLQTDPPEWVVYQRQLGSLAAHEKSFNHGQPLPQRDLDQLMMKKIETGQWELVEKRNYQMGDGWYVVRTGSGTATGAS